MRSEVRGTLARHYPDTDVLEIDQVAIRSFDAQGRLTTARARRALINADGSQVELLGQAEVVRAAKVGTPSRAELRLSGEQLLADLNTRRVTSHQAVLMQRGPDRVRADSLDLDDANGLAVLQGRVQGVIAASGAGR